MGSLTELRAFASRMWNRNVSAASTASASTASYSVAEVIVACADELEHGRKSFDDFAELAEESVQALRHARAQVKALEAEIASIKAELASIKAKFEVN